MRGHEPVSQRAKRPDSFASYCRIIGCPHPARAGTENGLDRRYCRRHADHYSRHGSPTKRSYPASLLKPFRKVFQSWAEANDDDVFLRNAVQRIDGLYGRSGAHIEAFRLAGLSPRERAWAAWARLREASVSPLKPVEAWVTIELAIAFDPAPDLSEEFKLVQAAKRVHRLASGSHKVWEHEAPRRIANYFTTETRRTELHVYPHSRGRVLRHLGNDLKEACGLLSMERLGSIKQAVREAGIDVPR